MMSLALLWGWPLEAAILGLTWSGILRIGEVLLADRSDLVLPCDALPGTHFALLRIRTPKTRGRAARHQAARIDPLDVISLLTAVFARRPPDAKLWPYSAATLRKRFSSLLVGLELPTSKQGGTRPFDLGSLRPGGATFLLLSWCWVGAKTWQMGLSKSLRNIPSGGAIYDLHGKATRCDKASDLSAFWSFWRHLETCSPLFEFSNTTGTVVYSLPGQRRWGAWRSGIAWVTVSQLLVWDRPLAKKRLHALRWKQVRGSMLECKHATWMVWNAQAPPPDIENPPSSFVLAWWVTVSQLLVWDRPLAKKRLHALRWKQVRGSMLI